MSRVEVVHPHLGPIALHSSRAQLGTAREARDAPSADTPAGVHHEPVEARAALARVVPLKESSDLGREALVLFRMHPGRASTPSVETGRRHRVATAQQGYAEVRASRVDKGERAAFRAEQNRRRDAVPQCAPGRRETWRRPECVHHDFDRNSYRDGHQLLRNSGPAASGTEHVTGLLPNGVLPLLRAPHALSSPLISAG